jgi:hypothetical protein
VRSSAFSDQTERARPPPSSASSGSGYLTQERSGCWAWTRKPTELPSAPFDDRLLSELPEVTRVERQGQGQHVVVTGTGELVNAVILTLAAAGVTARDTQLDSSNLEDAFVKLTGTHLPEEGAVA